MDLFSRFRKDYINYLISIIVPTIITAVSIPLFKQLLGSKGYGNFSITFNTVLLCTATLTGWVSQSVIRFMPASNNKSSFVQQSVILSAITQAIFFVPVFLIVWYLKADVLMALFFSITLFVTSLQFSVLAISQTVFLSKKSIFSELIRTVSYITVALILLKYSNLHYMYALFISIILSYLLSFLYLRNQIQKLLQSEAENNAEAELLQPLFKKFIAYGGPLSLWFVFAYLITLTDKYFILQMAGAEVQGNYQAMFDLLYKSISVIVSPVIISMFPLLTTAYQKGETEKIKKLLFTILGFELLGMLLACGGYWWFGADILFHIIKIPVTFQYKLMGLVVIAGTFMWLMAMVVHKRYELRLKSNFLLLMIIIAFASQLLLYVFCSGSKNILLYPIGYALSSVVYLFLVSVSFIYSKSKFTLSNK